MKKLLFTFVVALLYVGCDDTLTVNDIDKREIPASNVSFRAHILPVFEIKCNNSGCHDDGTRAGNLSLTTWASTTSDPAIVFPNEP